MTPLTYEQKKKNRESLRKKLKMDKPFVPFIGHSYGFEDQKRILFIAYDEWAYMTNGGQYDKTPGFKRKELESPDMTVSTLFRSSPYFRDIDKVLKAINSGLTAEDVAFYNFVIRPIDWNRYKKFRNDRTAYYIDKSIEAFKAVIDFFDPHLVIFCAKNDYNQINRALNYTLNQFLRVRGIEYLESANLNYEMTPEVPEKDNPAQPTANPIRTKYGYADLNAFIKGHPQYKRKCEYDDIRLDLQQVKFIHDKKYPNIPEELQKLAAFIDNELNVPGSFMRHRMLQALKNFEREVQKNYTQLMTKHIEKIQDETKFFKNPLCTEIRPQLYRTLHMLKAITREYEKAIVEQTIPNRKFCCTVSSNEKREYRLKDQAQKRIERKQKALSEIIHDPEEAPDEQKISITKKRWANIRNSNQHIYDLNQNNETIDMNFRKKYEKLIEKDVYGSEELSPEEKQCIDQNFERFMNFPREYEVQEQDKSAMKVKAKIIDMIKKDRSIPLHELSEASFIDEYYLGKLLKCWGIKKKNQEWNGSILNNN